MEPLPVAVWLFGPTARDEMTVGSDIDVLIVTP